MDFNDFFKKRNNYYKNEKHQNYYKKDHYKYKFYTDEKVVFNKQAFITSLRNNKKLKLFLIFIAFVLIVLIIVFFAVLLPLLSYLIDFISQKGFSGLLDELIGFLNKLWSGA
ncbi:hypothetical protein [Flavobacterium sp. GP15]|uniref:hypothetical protein n=1 Tax=Flavobacterium sp. GP15 TaxID=2758567 RepID=UPI00165D7D92|nr:hypothetical protein [Flavobacterium sp. GP15]